jgi:hypothetical protein
VHRTWHARMLRCVSRIVLISTKRMWTLKRAYNLSHSAFLLFVPDRRLRYRNNMRHKRRRRPGLLLKENFVVAILVAAESANFANSRLFLQRKVPSMWHSIQSFSKVFADLRGEVLRSSHQSNLVSRHSMLLIYCYTAFKTPRRRCHIRKSK